MQFLEFYSRQSCPSIDRVADRSSFDASDSDAVSVVCYVVVMMVVCDDDKIRHKSTSDLSLARYVMRRARYPSSQSLHTNKHRTRSITKIKQQRETNTDTRDNCSVPVDEQLVDCAVRHDAIVGGDDHAGIGIVHRRQHVVRRHAQPVCSRSSLRLHENDEWVLSLTIRQSRRP